MDLNFKSPIGPGSVSRRDFVRRGVAAALALPLFARCAPPPVAPSPAPVSGWLEREAYLMGTTLRINARAGAGLEAALAVEAAFAEVRRLERLLSSWRPDSEIGRLNNAPSGEVLHLDAELLALLSVARRQTAETGGAFDPAIGALIEAWGLRGEGRAPSAIELADARGSAGWEHFSLNAEAGTAARLDESAWIDTGAFGKGAALVEAERELRKAGIGDALLDFGGQLTAMGGAPGERAWAVSVAHPARRDEPFTELRLRDRSAATTAQSERWVEVAGRRIGHVLDPRTGQPVPPWGSVTVVSEDALAADVLSTALFVMGPEEGVRWARERDQFGALFLIGDESKIEVRQIAAMEEFRAEI